MKKRSWILLLALLLVLAAGYGAWQFGRKTPDAVTSTPDLVISAAALAAAFEQDVTDTDKRFLGKVLQVSGTVKRIDTSGAVVLSGGDVTEIVLGLADRYRADAAKVKPGQQAVFQGVYSGYEAGSGEDLLAALGTTVQLRSAGLKQTK